MPLILWSPASSTIILEIIKSKWLWSSLIHNGIIVWRNISRLLTSHRWTWLSLLFAGNFIFGFLCAIWHFWGIKAKAPMWLVVQQAHFHFTPGTSHSDDLWLNENFRLAVFDVWNWNLLSWSRVHIIIVLEESLQARETVMVRMAKHRLNHDFLAQAASHNICIDSLRIEDVLKV
jgi:hypothetical protein